MKPRRKAIVTAGVVGLATTLAPTVRARAADRGEVQDLRREVSQLRADAQSLQLALADLAEEKRQGSVNLTRALEESAPFAESTAPAAAPPTPPAPDPPATSGESKSRKTSHHHRHRHSSRARSRDR